MWVKLCGLTDLTAAQQIIDLRPDAIGLNFYAKSRRYVDTDTARQISAAASGKVIRVGVFVDHSPADILHIAQNVGLDVVQLHGDYSPDLVTQLNDWPFIWVYRLGQQGLLPLQHDLEVLHDLGRTPHACLVDSCVPGEFGGSGHRVDWTLLATEYARLSSPPPLLLAGGLTVNNVAAAIQTVQPWGVDVASGVETDGVKDLAKCAAFLAAARALD